MASSSRARDGEYPYDVALSFASEQRNYVDKVARALRRRGLRPFYDRYEQASLWGKDLYEHLDNVYRKQARYCVIFVSKAYAEKAWTTHERRSAQARALEESAEYVLPVRFDESEVPGLRPTVLYIDAGVTMPGKLATMIAKKLGPQIRESYLPSPPDKLFAALDIASVEEEEACVSVASSFMETLERMSRDELELIVHIVREGCPAELFEDHPHMNLDVLRRDLRTSPDDILQRFRGIRSLGFSHEVRENVDGHVGENVVSFEWSDRRLYDDAFCSQFAMQRSTEVAEAMIRIGGDGHCRDCGVSAIERCDFSQLASK